MENKKTWWQKLTVKNIGTTCGIIIFVLVFLFTFLFTTEFKDEWRILLAVFGSLVGAVGIGWLVLVLLVKKKQKLADPNQRKIEEAIKKVDDQNNQDKSQPQL